METPPPPFFPLSLSHCQNKTLIIYGSLFILKLFEVSGFFIDFLKIWSETKFIIEFSGSSKRLPTQICMFLWRTWKLLCVKLQKTINMSKRPDPVSDPDSEDYSESGSGQAKNVWIRFQITARQKSKSSRYINTIWNQTRGRVRLSIEADLYFIFFLWKVRKWAVLFFYNIISFVWML